MKSITKILILIFAFVVIFLGFVIFNEVKAAIKCTCPDGRVYEESWGIESEEDCKEVCEAFAPESQPTEEGVTPESQPTGGGAGGGGGKYGLEAVSGLPKGEISDVIIRIVQYVLGLVGVVLFAMLIYGGFMYMTSAGNEEQIKKAKNVLTYAIIGIVIIAMAFLITQFIIGALGGGGEGGGG
jgi:hypothetical protein